MIGTLTSALILVLSVSAFGIPQKRADDVPRITKEELKSMLGNPGVIIVDVRQDQQWKSSHLKILGAVHESPEYIEFWAGLYAKGKTLVLY